MSICNWKKGLASWVSSVSIKQHPKRPHNTFFSFDVYFRKSKSQPKSQTIKRPFAIKF